MQEQTVASAPMPAVGGPVDWYARLSAWPGYDVFMRLPALIYFTLVLSVQADNVADALFTMRLGSMGASEISVLSARLAALSVTVLFILFTLLRSKPIMRARGVQPRLVAFLGSTLLFATAFLPFANPSIVWETASTLLSATGGILTSVVVFSLGRSFSTMAEARTLITAGAYRWVRHPLYLAEEIIIIGGFLQYRSFAAAAILVVHFTFQLERMRNEEAVLAEAFPEYEHYRSNTARLIPGIY